MKLKGTAMFGSTRSTLSSYTVSYSTPRTNGVVKATDLSLIEAIALHDGLEQEFEHFLFNVEVQERESAFDEGLVVPQLGPEVIVDVVFDDKGYPVELVSLQELQELEAREQAAA